MSREVYVYADWAGLAGPTLVGCLRATATRRTEHFSFVYDESWLASPSVQQIDPELELFTGEQHCLDGKNFRSFLDSCPDRWGRLLMKRREAALARKEDRRPKPLTEVDYLLGVHDFYRQGAIRFKECLNGPFLDNHDRQAAPPFSSLRELEYAVQQVESSDVTDNALDFDLAMDVAEYFQLTPSGARVILSDVTSAVRTWREEAQSVGLSRMEQEKMSGAFFLSAKLP
ncbi:hypothetical protein NX722_26390 [Endozoicomonas gorgoniicola]|uniref:Toxin HipA n=1 Tax=Endozoicomonas gorgoniicola TaxID=1234144 RepID=A0ABT3N4H1_9GAMM|nr:hypothetical protein [Endozoicomonas gorgoniicola]MCW7556094.1 hypothetical protein [Endozoicomonas gorgoniicola]